MGMAGEATGLRVAMLTPEYVTEAEARGGAAEAMAKFAHGLRRLGHEPEVFVSRDAEPRVVMHEGARVERVGYAAARPSRWRAFCRRPGHWAHWLALLGKPRPVLLMAEAFARREMDRPFDLVFSLVLGASGALIVPRRGCPHLVRVTASPTQQLREWGGRPTWTQRVVLALWRHQLRQADVVIAPSELAAREYRGTLARSVHVVRTPAWREVEPAAALPEALPPRFLVHFGRLGESKGTFDVAEALRACWAQAPELEMVWLGEPMAPGVVERCRSMWGEQASRVHWFGKVSKPVLYAILQRAVASVLPSHIDNLPNAAIESLMFEVPVVGTYGSSLDELIEHGRSGELVAPGRPAQLAEAMLRLWHGQSTCQQGGFVPPAVFEQMRPEVAAQRLIDLGMAARERQMPKRT